MRQTCVFHAVRAEVRGQCSGARWLSPSTMCIPEANYVIMLSSKNTYLLSGLSSPLLCS